MTVTIHDVLEDLRSNARSEREKGDLFERVVAQYLRTDPKYADQFSDVWMWNDWPDRDGAPDTGIDLVAKDRYTSEYTAVQCKFYAETHHLQKSDIDSFFTASGKAPFSQRLIVSTTDHWSSHAEAALEGQLTPVARLRVQDLDQAPIDWADFSLKTPEVMERTDHKALRPHQLTALENIRAGFETHDRGKMIMACGTGKTFTSLKIVEDLVKPGGSVLFLVPSISLMSQSLSEWTAEADVPLRTFAVCSDIKVGKRKLGEDIGPYDLAIPATTNAPKLVERASTGDSSDRITVVFSTYQSIQVISEAQTAGLGDFDLIVCDEAHRTTGVTLMDQDESNFVKVHDNDYIRATKRLYMTATPRVYDDVSKTKAGEDDAILASMDDEDYYGPEFHRLGFGEAVEKNLLSDYKVLILAVDEKSVSTTFQSQLADDNNELRLDDLAKIVGCWNGLAKRGLDTGRLDVQETPMRRAVAFAQSIKASKAASKMFEEVTDLLAGTSGMDNPLRCESQHVDGTFNVLLRNEKLDWLKAPIPDDNNTCRILTNARCLSEGVDVPALDAVLFLNPRNSVVDVVQSVGRVMRKAPGKEYGYVILPIGIPADMTPEEALKDNKKYKVVWQVLQALRAHDDRFNAMVNKLDLNQAKNAQVEIMGVGTGEPIDASDGDSTKPDYQQLGFNFDGLDEWRDAIYAKIVTKVGDRRYWEQWATDIAVIADRHVTRIKALLDDPALDIGPFFDTFHTGLRANLNDGISRDNAIEMLAQHIITKPVFDALFEGYDFAAHNPVSRVMQDMLDVLDEQGIDTETETLDTFYESVRMRAAGIDNAEGKQRIITELYEKFFKNAFPKAAESLGIVYTPIEIVDFILRGVEHLLVTEFGSSLGDQGVHVLDPFTGTGTFIVRLLQSGLISADDLLHKYTHELHANEINLLAYYVAAVNIEATMHGIAGGDYRPFEGIVLTDTFQMHEDGDTLDYAIFPQNNERVVRQKATDIRVIVGNPPYSAGQTSANDDNANLKYPTLDARIENTYAKRSGATNKNSLYDSYVRAIRWASDRVGDKGVVAYVSNGGWIDSNTADGLRLCLAEEFDAMYVYNLRGNARTAGEQRRMESGNAFGGGSRTTIAIAFLVKTGNTPASERGKVFYQDIGDYLTREQKLNIIDNGYLDDINWELIVPNDHGDWINQRRDDFEGFAPILSSTAPSVFALASPGVQSNRDAWVYNSSAEKLQQNVRRMADSFNDLVANGATEEDLPTDMSVIKWSSSLVSRLRQGRRIEVASQDFRRSTYRPFESQNVCITDGMIHRPGKSKVFFPNADSENLGYYVVGAGSDKPFAALITNLIPDLAMWGSSSGQFFPRYTYEGPASGGDLFAAEDSGYRRIDNITDTALKDYSAAYGDQVTKDDIFYYVYGLLHSPTYRGEFAADLKKMLPRIPLVRDFASFAEAGRQLADMHLNYETVTPYPLDEIGDGSYRVQKMAFGKGKDKSRIVYNSSITLAGIPEDAYRYMLGSRSAIEWIIDRYQVKTDKASGIVNDPNDWATEHNEPRYIIDLLKRIVTVSIQTMKIVDALPELDIIDGK